MGIFNNTNQKEFSEVLTNQRIYFDVDFNSGGIIPPPTTYFLLDNSGEHILDNSDEPILV